MASESSEKWGDKNWEEWRGGVWDGLCPPQLEVWGLPPEKNQFCAKNYAILSKFWYFFLYYSIRTFSVQKLLPAHQRKWGLSPVLKVGDLSPCPPCSDAYGYIPRLTLTTEFKYFKCVKAFQTTKKFSIVAFLIIIGFVNAEMVKTM